MNEATIVTVNLAELKPTDEVFDLIGETVRLDVADYRVDEEVYHAYGTLSMLSFVDGDIVLNFEHGQAPLQLVRADLDAEETVVTLNYRTWDFGL